MTFKIKGTKKLFLNAFIFSLLYGALFYLLQFFFLYNNIFTATPTATSIQTWDVAFYQEIIRNGYENGTNSTGFFILFPLFWKVTHLGAWGIVVANILLFSLGFAFVALTLKEDNKITYLLWLTLPSVYFAFLPYTEAMFFFLSATGLYAIKKEKKVLLWISLLLLSLVRATGVFLIPAFIIAELWSHPPGRWLNSLWKALYLYISPLILGLAIFVLWQYHETGVWFIYFKTQATTWGHTFSWPEFPFTNIENAAWRYHWLSAFAMLIDIAALITLAFQGIYWLKKKMVMDKVYLVSAGYLFMVLVSILFLNPKYGNHTTNVMGINRYTLITPYCFIFLHALLKIKFSYRHILLAILLLQLFWQLFDAYREPNVYITIASINNLLVIALMLYARNKERFLWMIIPVIAFNLFAQLHLFQQFITPMYVD